MTPFRAMFSSDWNQCLAPCGPFDCISFSYPEIAPALQTIFKSYTANRISLGRAAERIRDLLPETLSTASMDAYLRDSFSTYSGVAGLIEWCARHRVLFMINTTGAIGYFQRALALEMLPPVPVLAAHPLIRYAPGPKDPAIVSELLEIDDKARYSAEAARRHGIEGSRVIVMGDSGGDGPHFAWASAVGAFKIGSMTKPSLSRYCREVKIGIDLRFGVNYEAGQERHPGREMAVDFMDLVPVIEDVLAC